MTGILELAARIRNIFITGSIIRRKAKIVQVSTRFSRAQELDEFLPYGFTARPLKGTALLFYEGGDSRSPLLLYIADQEQAPELEDGESALWNEANATVIAKKDGSVELNGGNFGGLIKINELVEQLEKNREILQIFLQALVAPVNEPGDGSPSAFQAALRTALAGKVPGDFSNIENPKVKHGDGQT